MRVSMQQEMRDQGEGGPRPRGRHVQEMEHRYTVRGSKVTEGGRRASGRNTGQVGQSLFFST